MAGLPVHDLPALHPARAGHRRGVQPAAAAERRAQRDPGQARPRGAGRQLARRLSLPQETQEAARIDGAGFFSLHWRITIPQLRSVIWFYAVIEGITMI